MRALLAELIPFGGETLAASLRQMTRLARGFELLSLALVVWGSSGIFMPVEMVLNRVWGGARGAQLLEEPAARVPADRLRRGALALVSVALTARRPRRSGASWPLVARLGGKAAALLLTLVALRSSTAWPRRARSTCARRRARGLWAAVLWEASKYAFVWNLGRMQLATLLRAARVRRVAGAVGLRLEPGAGVRARSRRRAPPAPEPPARRLAAPPLRHRLEPVELLAVAEGDQQVARLEHGLGGGVEDHLRRRAS